jgi:ribosomal protein L11 methyltransferase
MENTIYTTTAGAEAVIAILTGFGIEHTAIDDSADLAVILAGKDEFDWDYVDPALFSTSGGKDLSPDEAAGIYADIPRGEARLRFYTADDAGGEALLDEIRVALLKLKGDEQYGLYGSDADFGRLYLSSQALSDDWRHKWKEGFRPFEFTRRFTVCPPWEIRDGEILIIDPGMAFGTGSHETTLLCASAIEAALDSLESLDSLSGSRLGTYALLDIGSGSGILSILAALYGTGRITAIEFDEDAASSSELNFERNGVKNRIELIRGDIRKLMENLSGFDIIVANLTSGLLKQILPGLRGCFSAIAKSAAGGKLILSGLLADEEEEMRVALGAAGYVNVTAEIKGDWLRLCADCY